MPRDPSPIEEVLTRLAEGPGHIAAVTSGLTAEQLRTEPEPGEWSANDILAHVRACQDVWAGLIRASLTQGRSPRNAIHPRTYVKKTDYLKLDFGTSLQAFSTGRAELMSVLITLPAEGWERTGPARGWALVSGRSLIGQANGIAHHEAIHIEQIEVIVGALRGQQGAEPRSQMP